MAGESLQQAGGPRPAVALLVPFGVLLGTLGALAGLTTLHPSLQIAIAAGAASLAAVWSARKLAVPFLLLGVLTWAGHKSELSPLLLWQNREQASEYVFGRSLSPEERADVERRAARSLELGVRDDAERRARADLGLDRGDPVPPDFAALVDAAETDIRAETAPAEWARRLEREEERLAQQRQGGYFPPETSPRSLELYATMLLETVAIAVWGTAIAVVLALPMSFLGASRTLNVLAPGRTIFRRVGRGVGTFFTRRGFDACRGFNEFVLALIFVAVLGLGPFAGVLALAVHTFGVLGKVFSDAIETARAGEIEGVTATGAAPLQTVSFAVVPQIMPYVVSQSLLRFESNVRSASVLGLVGAGGIGYLIDAKIKSYQFQEVATMMIMIILAVSVVDFLCGRIMRRFI